MPVCSPTFKKMYSFQVLVFLFCFLRKFFNPVLTSAADSSPVWGTVQFTNGSCRRDPALLEFSTDPLCTNTSVPISRLVSCPVLSCWCLFKLWSRTVPSVTRLCVHLCERCETRVLSFLYSEPIVITLYPQQTEAWGGKGGHGMWKERAKTVRQSSNTWNTWLMSVVDFSFSFFFLFLDSKKKCRRVWDTLTAKDKQSKEIKAFISLQKKVCGTASVLGN